MLNSVFRYRVCSPRRNKTCWRESRVTRYSSKHVQLHWSCIQCSGTCEVCMWQLYERLHFFCCSVYFVSFCGFSV